MYAFLAARHKMFPGYKEQGLHSIKGQLVMYTSNQVRTNFNYTNRKQTTIDNSNRSLDVVFFSFFFFVFFVSCYCFLPGRRRESSERERVKGERLKSGSGVGWRATCDERTTGIIHWRAGVRNEVGMTRRGRTTPVTRFGQLDRRMKINSTFGRKLLLIS